MLYETDYLLVFEFDFLDARKDIVVYYNNYFKEWSIDYQSKIMSAIKDVYKDVYKKLEILMLLQ